MNIRDCMNIWENKLVRCGVMAHVTMNSVVLYFYQVRGDKNSEIDGGGS